MLLLALVKEFNCQLIQVMVRKWSEKEEGRMCGGGCAYELITIVPCGKG